MQSTWKAARRDGMAPIERAIILGALALVLGGGALLTYVTSEGEPIHWYELLYFITAVAITGLVSDMPLWRRIPIGASLLIIDSNIFDMAFDRPNAYAPATIAATVAGSIAFTTFLPLLDPPGWLRRWSRGHRWRWPVYYLVSVIVLQVSVVSGTLVNALFLGHVTKVIDNIDPTQVDSSVFFTFIILLFVTIVALFLLVVFNYREVVAPEGRKCPAPSATRRSGNS